MRIDNNQLSAVIGDIYDCALQPEHWTSTLEKLAGLFDACAGILGGQSTDSASPQYSWGVTRETMVAYLEKYVALNPFLTMGWHFDIDDPITVERFMPPEELRRTQFYREFLVPANWFDQLSILLQKSATQATMISFPKALDAPPPTQDEKDLLRLLAPHIRRATILHGVLGAGAARANDLAAVLDLIGTPVMLFDADGVGVGANAAAHRFLQDNQTLRLDDGRLRARDRELNTQIGEALTTATAPMGVAQQPLTFAIAQPDGTRFAGHLMPLAGSLRDGADRQGRARTALFIQPVGELQPLPGEVLVKLYGLTPAETRLLALLGQDLSLDETAATLGITMPTARTHLQRIFQKTNTNRQSQLVRLVLSALPRSPS